MRFSKQALFFVLVSVLLLAGCSGGAIKAPSFPVTLFEKKTDKNTNQTCNINVERAEVTLQDGAPPQPFLRVEGSFPASCGQLAMKITPPNLKNEVRVELAAEKSTSSKAPAGASGASSPFFINMALQHITRGKFTLWINGQLAGEFNIP